ncbi:MAG: hypothetical protein LIP02_11435 [Bacteroidales bacterium]|nr:hypothetical protein [Bacteroidales bacterium]
MRKVASLFIILCVASGILAGLSGCRHRDKAAQADEIYQTAVGHYRQGVPMTGDSLLADAAQWYQSREPLKAYHCQMLEAMRLLELGKLKKALTLLDSLEAQPDFPPMLVPELIEMRLRVTTQSKDPERMLPDAKRLLAVTRDMDRRLMCLQALQSAFEQLNQPDSALIANDMILIMAEELPGRELKRPALVDRARLLQQSGLDKDASALLQALNDGLPASTFQSK